MREIITSAEAARLAGVGTTAIKRWADSGVLPCIRTAGGHRRFDQRDVERFLRSDGSHEQNWDGWLEALVEGGDTFAIQARLFDERARRGSWHGAAQALGHLVTEIGRRWSEGQLPVIEEHLASSALQRALATVSDAMAVRPGAPRCLLAPVEGDEHTLGLSLVELCLKEAGWRTQWAGQHTRTLDIVDRVKSGRLAMVAVSAASVSSDATALAAACATIGEACQAENVTLVVGGAGAWPETPAYGTRFHTLDRFFDFASALADTAPA